MNTRPQRDDPIRSSAISLASSKAASARHSKSIHLTAIEDNEARRQLAALHQLLADENGIVTLYSAVAATQ